MKKQVIALICGATFMGLVQAASSTTPVNQIDLTLGKGIPVLGTKSPSQTLGQVSYRYTPSWYYVEAGTGGWIGSRHTGIANLQVGLNYKDFAIGIGPAYITTTSTSLGTHYQFMSTARWTFNPYPIYIEFDHVSDGRRFFGGPGPNAGENFIGVGYVFAL